MQNNVATITDNGNSLYLTSTSGEQATIPKGNTSLSRGGADYDGMFLDYNNESYAVVWEIIETPNTESASDLYAAINGYLATNSSSVIQFETIPSDSLAVSYGLGQRIYVINENTFYTSNGTTWIPG